jgi:hypothetical protein
MGIKPSSLTPGTARAQRRKSNAKNNANKALARGGSLLSRLSRFPIRGWPLYQHSN